MINYEIVHTYTHVLVKTGYNAKYLTTAHALKASCSHYIMICSDLFTVHFRSSNPYFIFNSHFETLLVINFIIKQLMK